MVMLKNIKEQINALYACVYSMKKHINFENY